MALRAGAALSTARGAGRPPTVNHKHEDACGCLARAGSDVQKGPTVSHRGRKTGKILIRETHEPVVPNDWPEGHVGVELTTDEIDECMRVRIHDVEHYLHSTTARELSNMLLARIEQWNELAIAQGHDPV